MPQNSLRAVIFDLDGVLVSTSKFHAQAWCDLVRSLGIEPPADLEERVKGISRMASLKIALGEHAAKFSEAEMEKLATQKNEHYLRLAASINPSDLFEGVKDLFDDLKRNGIKIALGSASKNAQPVLDGLGIAKYFEAVIDGFKYKHGKPHPDIFQTAARACGAEPRDCIVVEDAAAGISSAIDGGFTTVAMGSYESLKHAHVFVRSLREVDAKRLTAEHAKFRSDLWTLTTNTAGEGVFAAKAPAAGLAVTITIGGEKMELAAGKAVSLQRRLDLHSGIAWTDTHWVSPSGQEMKITERSFADRAHRGRTFHQYEIEPLTSNAPVVVTAGIAGAAQAQAQGAAVAAVSGGKTIGVALAVKDRPQAKYTAAGAQVRAETEALKDKVLCVEVCEVSPCLAAPQLPQCLVGDTLAAAVKAAGEGFPEARIASAAAWREFWKTTPAADLKAREQAFAAESRLLG